jgi:hypothetical protein
MRARFFSQLAVSPGKAQQISEAELFCRLLTSELGTGLSNREVRIH